MIFGNCAVLEQNLNHFLSSILFFCLNNFTFVKDMEFWKIIFWKNKNSRIHKKDLPYKLCTILEWDKWKQYADYIKLLIFWFVSTQSCKTSFKFFLDQTLCLTRYFFFSSKQFKYDQTRIHNRSTISIVFLKLSVLHHFTDAKNHIKSLWVFWH